MKNILTGMAVMNIEPVPGMDMTGFFDRPAPAVGVHDDLKIKCTVFDDGKKKLALVICDLLGLSGSFTRKAAELAGEESGIPADNIIIACTHTHSGPASIFLRGCGEVSNPWLEGLKYRIAAAVKAAAADLKPSKLSYGTGKCDIGYNRVLKDYTEDSRDPQVGVLGISDAQSGKVQAVVVNYGCHPVVMGGRNLLFTRDYPYYLEEALRKSMGPDVNVIFANGCCGDQNPVRRDSFEIAEELGGRLAESVAAVSKYSLCEEDFEDAGIEINNYDLEIPLKFPNERKYFEDLKADFHKKVIEETLRDANGPLVRLYRVYIQWADSMLERIIDGTLKDYISVRVTVAAVGKLVIAALPFEVFHEIGLKIKERFGFDNTIVLGYANGNFGYLPSKKLFPRASYEASTAFRYYGYPGAVCESTEDIILEAITRGK